VGIEARIVLLWVKDAFTNELRVWSLSRDPVSDHSCKLQSVDRVTGVVDR
jgi:hypothetical protein